MSTPPDQVDDITVTSASLAPKGSPGTVQFGRKFSLIVANKQGQGVELGAFRCVFHIQRGDNQTPNSADVRVYNLTTATANSLAGKEFAQLAIQAGYAGNYGLIFRGNITQSRIGRESQTDSYVDFTAADGDEAFNFATMSLSLAAGTNAPRNAVQQMLQAMAAYGVSEDDSRVAADIKAANNALPRGVVYHGLARDKLRVFASENNCAWSIQDGQLVVQPLAEAVPGAEIVVSPDTGLVGIPEQTQQGISLTTLLNPGIRIGSAIRLKSTINQYRFGLGLTDGAVNPKIALQNQLNGDGLYYVMRADHTGDTRENEWYTNCVCLSIDSTVTDLSISSFPSSLVPGRIA
jgi:hypothetical protein